MGYTKEQRLKNADVQKEKSAERLTKITPLLEIAKKQFRAESEKKYQLLRQIEKPYFDLISNVVNGKKTTSDRFWENDVTIDPLVADAIEDIKTLQTVITSSIKGFDDLFKPPKELDETEPEKRLMYVTRTIEDISKYADSLKVVAIQLRVLKQTKRDLLFGIYNHGKENVGLEKYEYEPIDADFDSVGKPNEKVKGLLERAKGGVT